MSMDQDRPILLEAEHIRKIFPVRGAAQFSRRRYLRAVDDVSLTIHEGETVGLVGESGCGKSTLGRCLLGLYPVTEGVVRFRGEETQTLSHHRQRELCKQRQIIFQDPYASLNPRMTIYQSVKAPLDVFHMGSEEEKHRRVTELLDYVGIGSQHMSKYPHELSGGQRQRVFIARAIILQPSFVVCDEPVSALDVSVRSQVLNLMKRIQQEHGMAYLFISHDLSVVRYLCDRVVVMYLGKVVEEGSKQELFEHPVHPYTRALMSAIPLPDVHTRRQRIILSGDLPSPVDPPEGCRFCTRCPYATEECRTRVPKPVCLEGTHFVACHRIDAVRNDME